MTRKQIISAIHRMLEVVGNADIYGNYFINFYGSPSQVDALRVHECAELDEVLLYEHETGYIQPKVTLDILNKADLSVVYMAVREPYRRINRVRTII